LKVFWLDELAGHVAHATKAGGTKAHWKDTKIALDAAFVIGVVATADRAGVWA